MVAGLWMFIQDIMNRNYLHAYDIYMRLAVGTVLLGKQHLDDWQGWDANSTERTNFDVQVFSSLP